ncbi:hypothetical protein [Streptomyces collinus]|uniref:hypothetical protein n=1 Tax=Streptomyces collinus TaxID=42684 RepID=UPI0036A8000A
MAPAPAHLVSPRFWREELRILEPPATPSDATWHAVVLPPGVRSPATDAFLYFLRTPAATRIMRAPGAGRTALPVPATGVRDALGRVRQAPRAARRTALPWAAATRPCCGRRATSMWSRSG